MEPKFFAQHWVNEDGNPSGGVTSGRGFTISWQNGPLLDEDGMRKEPNGAFVEDVIRAAVDRLGFYQSGKFACEQNEIALRHLLEALEALEKRTQERRERGVEGTWQV